DRQRIPQQGDEDRREPEHARPPPRPRSRASMLSPTPSGYRPVTTPPKSRQGRSATTTSAAPQWSGAAVCLVATRYGPVGILRAQERPRRTISSRPVPPPLRVVLAARPP